MGPCPVACTCFCLPFGNDHCGGRHCPSCGNVATAWRTPPARYARYRDRFPPRGTHPLGTYLPRYPAPSVPTSLGSGGGLLGGQVCTSGTHWLAPTQRAWTPASTTGGPDFHPQPFCRPWTMAPLRFLHMRNDKNGTWGVDLPWVITWLVFAIVCPYGWSLAVPLIQCRCCEEDDDSVQASVE